MRYHGQMLGWTKRLFALLVLVMLTQWPGSGRGEGGGGGSAPDRDLEERVKLVTVPGAHFRFVSPQESGAESRAAESLQPVPCPVPAAGLCDINWLSAPTRWESTFVGSAAEVAALPLEQVLLRTQSGRPLLIAAAGEVVVMMDLRAGDVSRCV